MFAEHQVFENDIINKNMSDIQEMRSITHLILNAKRYNMTYVIGKAFFSL
jgi:hypothetical protein